MQQYINEIIKNNIEIDDEALLINYLKRYGYIRLIICYGNLTKIIKKTNKITTNEIIDVFNIDNLLANVMSAYLLDFDKQLNNNVIDIIFKHNQLSSDYVLEFINNPANSHLRNKGFATFIKDVYDNAKNCNLVNHLDSDIKNIPLRALAVSWSLNTLINFIYLQDDKTKRAIARYYGFYHDYDSFISICHTIRKFRNTVSHNGIFMSFNIDYFCEPFNYWLNNFSGSDYALNSSIDLKKMIEMLSIILQVDLKQELKKQILDMNLLTNIKNYFID